MNYSFTDWSKEQYCESIAIYGKFNSTYNPNTITDKPIFFEPINSITALFIMFIGAYGLCNSKAIYYYEDLLLFSSIFFNGIASLFNHGTLQIGWYNMDNLTMLLPSILAVAIHYNCLVILLKNHDFKRFHLLLHQNNEYDNEYTQFLTYKKIIIFCCMLYYYICITVASIPEYDIIFSILFAIPMIILWIPISYFLYFLKERSYNVNNSKLYCYFLFGGIICTVVGIIWFATELPCKANPAIAKYVFYTHGLWHIGMSIGIYYLVTSVILLNYYLSGIDNVGFKTSNTNKCKRCCLKIFPIIVEEKVVNIELIQIKK